MTSCPALLCIKGQESRLLVPPEEDGRVRLMLHGMEVAYRREAAPGRFVDYAFPGMGESEIQGVARLIVRQTQITRR